MPSSQPPTLAIAAGILIEGGRILVARRRPGAHAAGTWEFPGGKQRPGEPMEGALRREVAEETGMTFQRAVLLHVEEHVYPERTVALHFYLCLEPGGRPEGLEGQELRWVTVEELRRLEVPAANRRILEVLAEQLE